MNPYILSVGLLIMFALGWVAGHGYGYDAGRRGEQRKQRAANRARLTQPEAVEPGRLYHAH